MDFGDAGILPVDTETSKKKLQKIKLCRFLKKCYPVILNFVIWKILYKKC